MKNKRTISREHENIDLLRAGSVVSTLAGAFGGALRETRLTALLGYLIALEPDPFLKLFGFNGKPNAVHLENWHDVGRSDILVETTGGRGVIEAKVNATDPLKQSKKYEAKWTVLLTQYIPSNTKKITHHVKYLHWQALADFLKTFKFKNSKVRFISQDLLKYLEVNHMVKKSDPVEIYTREINEEKTLTMFLKAQIYGCDYKKGSRLPEALYFAPHFGKSIANAYPGVRVGISYIARIEQIEIVETWQDLLMVIKNVKKKTWLNSHLDEIKLIKSWDWSSKKKRSFLFLAAPRLVFNPSLHKKNIQKGIGRLSKHFFSFEDLFTAWEK